MHIAKLSVRLPITALAIAVLLFLARKPATSGEPPCAPTAITLAEAEQLVLNVPDAIAAAAMGGKLSALEEEANSATSYRFMLNSTVSLPTTPMGNGMLGHYSVSNPTARVFDIADEEVVGNELRKLQRKLRAEHCISAKALTEAAVEIP